MFHFKNLIMKKLKVILFAAIAVATLSSCSLAKVNGDEEGVMIMKPWFFGRGGVSDNVVLEGSTWLAPSTDFIVFKNTPIKFSEAFDDVMSDDNTPVDLQAYIILQIQKGKSAVLYKNYGESWYQNVVRETFRKSVRDRVSTFPMYDLTSNREVCETIENEVTVLMNEYFARLSASNEFPINVMGVVMDRARPNPEVMEEINRTASQIQAKQTQIKQGEMEVERAKTEKLKALADRAYRNEMGYTNAEYIQLRALEMEMSKVEMVRGKQNVNVDVMFGNAVNMWDIKK